MKLKKRKSIIEKIKEAKFYDEDGVKINLVGEMDTKKITASVLTKIIALIFIFFAFFIFITLLIDLESHSKDQMKSNTFTHDMKQDNEFKMQEINFLPYFEFKPMQTIDYNIHDILNSENPNAVIQHDYDLVKLGRYIKIMMLTRSRVGANQNFTQSIFRKCTDEDFRLRGYKEQLVMTSRLFCPSYETFGDRWKIKNNYANLIDRHDFSIQIDTCNPDLKSDCKDDASIQDLLQRLQITLFEFKEQLDFGNINNYGKRPIDIKQTFGQQFQLNVNEYRDNNNFLRLNKVLTKDQRFNPFQQTQKYQFFSVVRNPAWVAPAKHQIKQLYLDQQNFIMEKRRTLLGIYYFLDDDQSEHQRNAFDIVDLLAKMGGLAGFLMLICETICIEINYNMIQRELIEKMYFPQFNLMKNYKFDLFTVMFDIIPLRPFLFCFKRNKEDLLQFQKLKKVTENQLSIVHLLTRIQRLTFILTQMMKLPQFIEVRNHLELKFNTYIVQMQDLNRLQDDDLFSYLDNLGHSLIQKPELVDIIRSQLSVMSLDSIQFKNDIVSGQISVQSDEKDHVIDESRNYKDNQIQVNLTVQRNKFLQSQMAQIKK